MWSILQTSSFPDSVFGNQATQTVTMPNPLTPGSKLIAFSGTGTNLAFTLTDSVSGAWQSQVAHNYYSGDDYHIAISYCDNVSSGSSVVVTATTPSGQLFKTLQVVEVAGLAPGDPEVISAGKTNTAGTTSPTDTSMTTLSDHAMCIGALGTDGAASVTAAGGATLIGFASGSGHAWEYFEKTPAGAQAMAYTTSNVRSNSVSCAFAMDAGAPVYNAIELESELAILLEDGTPLLTQ